MESAPFAGVVVCCTSIPVDLRTDIAKKVAELGGVHKNDLTHEVTHLIVGDYNTPKYRHVASERPDIHPMCAGWVDAVLDLWTRDVPIDLAALEAAWRLRPLEAHGGLPGGVGVGGGGRRGGGGGGGGGGSGGDDGHDSRDATGHPPVERGRLLCSVTGFEEADRQAVIAAIVDNGGVYSGDLTRAVTHLVVNRPEGKKYAAAMHWGVKTVAVEWLRDCAARGMILDEAKYDPRLPPADRGKGAWVRTAAERSAVLGKRLRDAAAAASAASAGAGGGTGGGVPSGAAAGQRKLRKTASKKLSMQRDDLWGHILGKPAAGDGNEVAAAPSAENGPRPQKNKTPTPLPEQQPQPQMTTREAAAAPHPDGHTAGHTTGHTTGTAIPVPAASAVSSVPAASAASAATPANPADVLAGCVFCIYGFSPDRTRVLTNAVATMGGTVAASLEDMTALATASAMTADVAPLRQHVIVSQTARPETHPRVGAVVRLVTEFFVEQCLHKKRYALPAGDDDNTTAVLGRPFAVFPIPALAGLVVCTAGFSGVDLNQVDKAVRQIGAVYAERFTAQCAVLVVTALPAIRKQKLELALAWRVPVVAAAWLWACITAGALVSIEPYLFPPLRQSLRTLNGPAAAAAMAAAVTAVGAGADEPTMPLTVPTLVVANPHELLGAAAPEAKRKSAVPPQPQPEPEPEPVPEPSRDRRVDDIDMALTDPSGAAPTHREATAPTHDPAGGRQSPRRAAASSPPPPQPRQPLARVTSEIADSAAGDSDDPIESEDGGGGGSSSNHSDRRPSRAASPPKQQPHHHGRPNAPAAAAAAAAAAATAAATAATLRGSSTGARPSRPSLSRVISEGLAAAAARRDGPHVPRRAPRIGFGAGRSRSNISGMSVPETGDDLFVDATTNEGAAAGVTNIAGGNSHGHDHGHGVLDSGLDIGLGLGLGHDADDDDADPGILPPTQTQVQYLDPEADRIREQLMRKILGGAAAAGDENNQNNQNNQNKQADADSGSRVAKVMVTPAVGSAEEALAGMGRRVRRSSRLQ